MRGLFKKPRLDIEITQVPTLVNNSHIQDRDLTLKATAIVYSHEALSKASLLVAFTGERTTPTPTALFSASSSEQSKRILLRDNKRIDLNSGTHEGDLYRYEAPFEFVLPDGLPGTVSPLDKPNSSSIRYSLDASFTAGILAGTATCAKEVFLFRACRDDVSGLDTFVDNIGEFNGQVSYEIWSMKSVLCGGSARFHMTFAALKPDISVNWIRVVLKERQIVQVPVPAMHQTRLGEVTTLSETFDLAERMVDVPKSSARISEDKSSNRYTVLFDLSLPETTTGYRRSSATRGGIKLDHYFDIEVGLSHATGSLDPLKVRSNTALALPVEFESHAPNLQAQETNAKTLLVAPPAFDEFAPPSYGPHKIDPLYEGGETVVKQLGDQDVVFL